MRLLRYRYKCKDCHQWFEHHDIGPYTYGEFLLRSGGNGEERYLNGLTDPVFQEVELLLSSENGLKDSNALERADILHSAFGVACDPSSDGSLFQIGKQPCCPHCGSCKIEYWELIEPPQMVEKKILHVTHDAWNALSYLEKERALRNKLDEIGVQ